MDWFFPRRWIKSIGHESQCGICIRSCLFGLIYFVFHRATVKMQITVKENLDFSKLTKTGPYINGS